MGGNGSGLAFLSGTLPRFDHTLHTCARLWFCRVLDLASVGPWDGAGSELAMDLVPSAAKIRDGAPTLASSQPSPFPTPFDPEMRCSHSWEWRETERKE